MLDRLTSRVKPYAAPRFTRVTVDSKNVKDPESYARLWTAGTKANDYPRGDDMRQVTFYTPSPTPWSDANYVVAYPSDRLVMLRRTSLPRRSGASLGSNGVGARCAPGSIAWRRTWLPTS